MKVTSINPLNSICYALGILPTINTSCIIENRRRWSDYIRGICYIALFTSVGIYNLYGKFFVFGHGVHKTILFTYALADVTVTMINVISILLHNICYGKQVQICFKTLRQLETFIVDHESIPRNERNFKIKFALGNLSIIAFAALNGYQWVSSVGWDIYQYFLLKDFQNYHVCMTFWILAYSANLIGWRMKDLNKHLENVVLNRNSLLQATHGQRLSKDSQNVDKVNLKMISEAYTTIAGLIGSYNTIFGPIYIVINVNIVINILVPLNMALVYARGTTLMSGMNDDYAPSMLALCGFWVCFPCCLGLMIFAACDKAAKEAGKVPELCYELLKQIGDNDFKLREELERYANQADRLRPCFSAAGFFDINYGLTFPVFGSVISYIIVLLQFD